MQKVMDDRSMKPECRREYAIPATYADSARFECDSPVLADTADTADTAESEFMMEQLPDMLGRIVCLGNLQQEKELLLFAGITALSVCFPTVSGIYGDKRYASNLFFMAVGPAASGKGKMNLCRSILLPIHKKKMNGSEASSKEMLLIPANSSATAFQEILSCNPLGCIIFETEGDTLADTFEQDYGDYSSCFRGAFEHEMISYARRENDEHVEIHNPKLSVLLSGTPNQVTKLIKDPENGLFSRFAFYRLEATDEFHVDNNSEESESKEERCARIGEDLLKVYEKMIEYGPVNYKMTEQQWDRFNREINVLKDEYFNLYDKAQIRASIWRLGVIRFRISMILTVLKAIETNSLQRNIYCDDEIFEVARQMSAILAEHMTQVYRLLPNVSRLRGQFRTESERRLYLSLPNNFTRADYNDMAISQGLNPRTVERYLTAWKKDEFIICIRHGEYEKTGHS